jgi:hypothetical protein
MGAGEHSLGPVSLTACLIMTLYRWVPARWFLVSIVLGLFRQESASYRVLLLCKTPGSQLDLVQFGFPTHSYNHDQNYGERKM